MFFFIAYNKQKFFFKLLYIVCFFDILYSSTCNNCIFHLFSHETRIKQINEILKWKSNEFDTCIDLSLPLWIEKFTVAEQPLKKANIHINIYRYKSDSKHSNYIPFPQPCLSLSIDITSAYTRCAHSGALSSTIIIIKKIRKKTQVGNRTCTQIPHQIASPTPYPFGQGMS